MTDKKIIHKLQHIRCFVLPSPNHKQTIDDAVDLIINQQAEIERLKKYNTDVAHKHYDDGIKEFAERLKRELDMISYETAFEYQDTIETIDDLVKEMGGQNESND